MLQNWNCRFGSIKTITQLKKTINMGEIPNYYSLVANKLSELEGTFTDGFDNNIKYLLKKDNWQTGNLINGKPQVSLIKHLNAYSFDLHCFPIINDEPQMLVKPYDPLSPFKEFNPAVLGPLLRIPNLQEFINITIRFGDEADLELLKYTHMLVEQLVTLLKQNILVIENAGASIEEIYTESMTQLHEQGS
ncbi:hypothetical protein [Paraglaciecola marina]|uniref:hypothetical protein n=1 Tax=Paraglaciecola marina TaxID=2500157 RepID=UPI00105E0E8B|nr:hypothetical protein [Paraglaciecola marina]